MTGPTTSATTASMKFSAVDPGGWRVWSLFAILLVTAPLVFNKDASLSILCQMGTVMIFGLSYNMLLGQGGMLSFGHAVYSGLGAFFAIHAMKLSGAGVLFIPVTLIPLVGGVSGMLFGALLGYVTTKKSGTAFSMITLGIVELVFACSLMFPEFFGGEGGISANRVMGKPVLGISYGPQIQVYYLIAFWLFISTAAMYAFTQTPLGRIINAVRDNPERAEFIGYSARWARYLTLILSAFFAGISGGLAAINFEIVTAENVSAARSGAILLFTFIGGAGFFFGPMIGAVIGVFLTVMLSDFTKAWQLYLGVFFIVVVMYAPGGIAGILAMNLRLMRCKRFGQVAPRMALMIAATLVACVGAVMLIEMLYHARLESANGAARKLFGATVDTASPGGWLIALTLLAAGALMFWRGKPAFRRAWDEANLEIEEAVRSEDA
jgi:branched-chain amino acid transport system permease protein